VPLGPLEIDVSGAVVSTVQAKEAGVGSSFPAVSVAFTLNVCGPSETVCDTGELQPLNGALSRLHVNVLGSEDEKEKLAEVPLIVCANVVSGGVVSAGGMATVHVCDAGDGSVSPPTVACTSNVCSPFPTA
jgi:hypothetical protein